jgi:hypothetical protein
MRKFLVMLFIYILDFVPKSFTESLGEDTSKLVDSMKIEMLINKYYEKPNLPAFCHDHVVENHFVDLEKILKEKGD